MVLAEFSIWPMDKGESVGKYVARCVDLVDRSGLAYQLGPLGTCVEGEWDEVMGVIGQCYRALAADSNRISCSVKIDYRKDRKDMMTSKVESVEKALGRKLRT